MAAIPPAAASVEPPTCAVCCDEYTPASKQLSCAHCLEGYCSKCYLSYWADKPLSPLHCMAPDCRKIFSKETLVTAFSASYVEKVSRPPSSRQRRAL